MIELTNDGEKIASEVERRMWSKVSWIAGLFGIANLAALAGIYFGAVSAAEQAISARTSNSLEILHEVVSEAQSEIGDARQLIGVTEGQMLSVQVRLNHISESLTNIGDDTSRIENAAILLTAIDENPNLSSLLTRIPELEASLASLKNQTNEYFSGGIVMFSKSSLCPDGTRELALMNILSRKSHDGISLSRSVAVEDSSWNVGNDWDGLMYRACLFP